VFEEVVEYLPTDSVRSSGCADYGDRLGPENGVEFVHGGRITPRSHNNSP